jgi:hypothetical protein
VENIEQADALLFGRVSEVRRAGSAMRPGRQVSASTNKGVIAS